MLITGIFAIAATYVAGHWVAGVAVLVLAFVWRLLRPSEGPPVLALALSAQWLQVTLGIFYTPLTGVVLSALVDSNWVPMVLIGLGCIVALALGLRIGINVVMRKMGPPAERVELAFPQHAIIVAYAATVASSAAVQELAWEYPALTQAILAVSFSHLGLLYLLLRRFSRPVFRWRPIAALMVLEVALGFTGYFAGFREPLLMAFIMGLEVFDARDVRHWAMMGAIVVVMAASSVLWMSVRTEYRADYADELVEATRAERFQRVRSLAGSLDTSGLGLTVQTLGDRLWAIYYPALAVERVPDVVPHSDGQILRDALVHLVTPRILFPDKPELPSDSEMVRKYSGVMVAGAEEGTSIAFGYAAESYVDFGVPWMFLPVFLFGLLAGAAYQVVMSGLFFRELAIGVSTVIFWLSLYLFERSWVKTLGGFIALLVYLGGVTFLVDRYLLGRRSKTMANLVSDPLMGTAR